ncbi:hypothetical protein PVAND_000562 [Polypedilum vanderplanki]|uniref:HAT C-terminal dimerisation domain-containing protein n=1 Tax=Polypedilum vanderplanki TaxID=319348 RepID=A0A9J6BKH7_POLVA|nr:hypothetical protein PVAND_000562 [Polypedilum vanderplanki]
MTAEKFWNIVGRDKYPVLFQVSYPIAQMISSSAIAERTWSTFKFIHSRLHTLDKNDYILEDGAVLNEIDYEELNE